MESIWHEKIEYRMIPGDGRYVSRDGVVISLRRGAPKTLKPTPDTYGYYMLSRPPTRIHKAVALAWIGPRPAPKMEVRHLNGDNSDNRLSNLAWGTQKENNDDVRRHGTRKGEKNAASKMTPELVAKLRRDYIHKPLRVIMRENPQYSQFAIWAACSGYTWSHLPGAIPKRRTCYKK
jgi:hypothetical protein